MRKNISKAQQLAVWRRDHWHCCYCLRPVFFSPTLKLLGKLSPGHGYYHPNGKKGEMLSLFRWSWASVDHIRAVTTGGDNDLSNLVTACWRCNLSKRTCPAEDEWAVNEVPAELADLNWDGLSSLYLKLAEDSDGWLRLLAE